MRRSRAVLRSARSRTRSACSIGWRPGGFSRPSTPERSPRCSRGCCPRIRTPGPRWPRSPSELDRFAADPEGSLLAGDGVVPADDVGHPPLADARTSTGRSILVRLTRAPRSRRRRRWVIAVVALLVAVALVVAGFVLLRPDEGAAPSATPEAQPTPTEAASTSAPRRPRPLPRRPLRRRPRRLRRRRPRRPPPPTPPAAPSATATEPRRRRPRLPERRPRHSRPARSPATTPSFLPGSTRRGP